MLDLYMQVQTALTAIMLLTTGVRAYMASVNLLSCSSVMLLSTVSPVLIKLCVILVIERFVLNDTI